MPADNLDRLAIFGGTPQFQDQLHVGRPNRIHRELFLERVNDILDRKWYSNNGIYLKEFEEKIANIVGCKHCIAICNGTVALEIVIRAVAMNNEVIVPSFTYIATAHALKWQGITPVFCDIDPKTHNLCLENLEACITPNTTGIIGVHVWGRPCPVEGLANIAQKYKLKLIYDAAHAFGCSYKGKMVGNFGDAEIFSFHATKFINTFEGGAILTNNDQLAERVRQMKDFGYTQYNDIVSIGTNGKMSEMSAAMGLTMIESLPELIENNLQNYTHYQCELKALPGINLIEYDSSEKCNYQYIVLDIDENITGINRDDLTKILHFENVLARKYFSPSCHQTKPYYASYLKSGNLLTNTEELSNRTLCLPTGTAVNLNDISKICDIIKLVVTNSDQVRDRLTKYSHHPY